MIPFFDLSRQYAQIRIEMEESIKKTVSSCKYILGQAVSEFERKFADYLGVKYCIGVASGTDALTIALKSVAELDNRKEVITVPNTYVATAEAVIHAGLIPKFVDIDIETGLMDIDKLPMAINSNTLAIIPVHLYGQCLNMPNLMEVLSDGEHPRNIYVIEDSCQAHGASYLGQKAGTFGDAGCFSFYPSKNLGCFGDGGAIVTNEKRIYEFAISLRDHGQSEKNVHSRIGYNSRLDAIQATVLNVKLDKLESYNDRRRVFSLIYDRAFRDTHVFPLKVDPKGNAVFHLYVIKSNHAELLKDRLKESDIGFGVHYPMPIHLQPAYRYLGYKNGDFPNAETLSRNIISLPMYPEMFGTEVNFVINAVLGGKHD